MNQLRNTGYGYSPVTVPQVRESASTAAGPNLAIGSGMKPKLSESKLYLMHDRILCGKLRCCGHTAHFTGKTIGGARCVVMKQRDADEFAQAGETMQCESCQQMWTA